jgi:hypothetical protein
MDGRIMKPLIAIDDWKLHVYREILEAAGFAFTVSRGLTPDMLFLSLEIPADRFDELTATVKKCNAKAAELKN